MTQTVSGVKAQLDQNRNFFAVGMRGRERERERERERMVSGKDIHCSTALFKILLSVLLLLV